MSQRVIFHIDFDYFYAQCEEIRDPTIIVKPVVVCVFSNRGQDSGAVATANYVARKHGVKSGISISLAKKRLEGHTDAVFLPVDFDYYSSVSDAAMEIIAQHADVFEYVGRDEAYLDVTKKSSGNFLNAANLAQKVKNSVREKTKIKCSIGVTPNKLLSKMASDFKKPDGLTVVDPNKIEEFLSQQKIRDIPGIGKKISSVFTDMKLDTIQDLKKMDVFTLNRRFGRKTGTYIYNAARGINTEPVKEKEATVQYSKIITLKQNSKDQEVLLPALEEVCAQLQQTVLKNNVVFRSVGIQFFQSDLSSKTKSRMLKNSTNSLEQLQNTAKLLVIEALQNQELLIRRVGVRVSELAPAQGQDNITNYF